MNAWGALASVALAVHLTWIVWVIFGWLVARNRPVLRWFHLGSLIYGIFIEIAPRPHPLTLLEQWLESKAGAAVYGEPFPVHYLEAAVYPDVPERVAGFPGSGRMRGQPVPPRPMPDYRAARHPAAGSRRAYTRCRQVCPIVSGSMSRLLRNSAATHSSTTFYCQ